MGVVNTGTPLSYPTEVSKAVYLVFCIINRCCGDSDLLKKPAETCPCHDGTGLFSYVVWCFLPPVKSKSTMMQGKGK